MNVRNNQDEISNSVCFQTSQSAVEWKLSIDELSKLHVFNILNTVWSVSDCSVRVGGGCWPGSILSKSCSSASRMLVLPILSCWNILITHMKWQTRSSRFVQGSYLGIAMNVLILKGHFLGVDKSVNGSFVHCICFGSKQPSVHILNTLLM